MLVGTCPEMKASAKIQIRSKISLFLDRDSNQGPLHYEMLAFTYISDKSHYIIIVFSLFNPVSKARVCDEVVNHIHCNQRNLS